MMTADQASALTKNAKDLARAVDKGGFSRAAIAFAEETGSDIEADIALAILGYTDGPRLLAECLEGADDDRIPGIRDYVSTVMACAARA